MPPKELTGLQAAFLMRNLSLEDRNRMIAMSPNVHDARERFMRYGAA